MRVLLLGDIVGQSGCRGVFFHLPALRKSLSADAVIANAENAADGLGLDVRLYEGIRAAGVDVVTSGNHIWQKREILPLLDADERLLRPENYPPGVPGHGSVVLDVAGEGLAVVNLEGRKFLSALRCPFATARQVLARMRPRPRAVVVDFHAESSEEKEALAFHLDGKVSAVVGTHTHVQTADERVLPGGTGYLTDAGMCGSSSGVIGMRADVSLKRFVTQMPLKLEVDDGPAVLHGVLLDIDPASGSCRLISRVRA